MNIHQRTGRCQYLYSGGTADSPHAGQRHAGDPHAAEQLLPLVFNELRKLAAQRLVQERPGHTLQATALVHEAYLRLVDVDKAQAWNGRGHFFAAAAEAMRRILVERVRHKGRIRHGGDLRRVELLDAEAAVPTDDDQMLLLDEGCFIAASPICP
jgi:RNA polymerase sigma factor (TIGR02999 family)